jgi:hypothetical protein
MSVIDVKDDSCLDHMTPESLPASQMSNCDAGKETGRHEAQGSLSGPSTKV